MTEYINQKALLTRLEASPIFDNFGEDGAFIKEFVLELIKIQPTADVVEVRHGHWITRDVRCLEKEVECSVCHSKDYYSPEMYRFIRYPAYCSDCGAKMDGDKNDT